jgi:hypothetical protein
VWAGEAQTTRPRAADVLCAVLHAPRAPGLQAEACELDIGDSRLVVGDRKLPRQRIIRAEAKDGVLLVAAVGVELDLDEISRLEPVADP